ncbi:MAG: hypothetical protein AAGC85_04230 [Bacteroidota bacterium]
MCRRRKHGGKKFLLGIFAVAGMGFLVMILWNTLIPSLFGGPYLSFLQALGLLILSKILFSGGPCRSRRGGWGAKEKIKHHWKEKIREKMKHMSPEEREAFKKSFKGKWNRFDVEVFEVEDEEEEKDNGDDQDKGDDAPPKSGKGRKKS